MIVTFLCSGTIRVWELDLPNRKIWPTECQTGQQKRIVMTTGVSVASTMATGGNNECIIVYALIINTGPSVLSWSVCALGQAREEGQACRVLVRRYTQREQLGGAGQH